MILRNTCRIKGPPQGEDAAQARHRTSLNGAAALKRARAQPDPAAQRSPALIPSPGSAHAASLAPFALNALPAPAAVPAAVAGTAAGLAGAPALRRASAEAQGPALPAGLGEGASGFSLGLTLSQQGPAAGAPGSADEPQAWAMRPHASSVRGNSGASDAARYGLMAGQARLLEYKEAVWLGGSSCQACATPSMSQQYDVRHNAFRALGPTSPALGACDKFGPQVSSRNCTQEVFCMQWAHGELRNGCRRCAGWRRAWSGSPRRPTRS